VPALAIKKMKVSHPFRVLRINDFFPVVSATTGYSLAVLRAAQTRQVRQACCYPNEIEYFGVPQRAGRAKGARAPNTNRRVPERIDFLVKAEESRKQMTDDSTALSQLLEFAVRLAREAGEIAHHYFQGSFTPERKADNSFVTVADREAERHIRSAIERAFPDDTILGEEDGEKPGDSPRRWIIDPIDGTFAFVHGVPFFGVMIGLEVAGEPSLGVVNLPALNEIIYAAKGSGCFWNGQRARVSVTSSLDSSLLLATDFSSSEQHRFGPALEDLRQRAQASRTWGDCYGHMLVATGRADVMLDPVMNIWDCAALLPIMEEAGGSFTDWDGRRTVRGGNAVSTNGALFDEVMETIRKAERA
jgi:histidinol-phosphatase